MFEEKEEYTDTPPSHILYDGKNFLYIKNSISSNTLSISKSNLEMNNINFKTIQSLSDFSKKKAYGIFGVVNFKNIPCLVFGKDFEAVTFYMDKAVYRITNIDFIILSNSENKNLKEQIKEDFKNFKQGVLKTHLIFSNHHDLTIPYWNQYSRNKSESNSFMHNYELVTLFQLNNNIKNKNDFYTKIIEGNMYCYSHDVSGEDMLFYIIYRKDCDMNYYESEVVVRYGTDSFNYVHGMKIGNEKFTDNFIQEYAKKTGLLFNCSNFNDEKYFKKNLPHLNYIKYNGKDFKESTVESFLNEENKEIKKTQYYYTCKDPITGKISNSYRQQESDQNGSCIFVFNDNESMILFNKCFNAIIFTNYLSQYQKEKDFKKQNNEFIQVNKLKKIDYFYSLIKEYADEFYSLLKKSSHFKYKNYIYKIREHKSKKKDLHHLKLFVETFNASAIEPNIILSKFDVNSFIFPKKFEQYISKNHLPDIIYICFEEIVELNANNVLISSNQDIVDLYTKKITSEICKYYPYILKIQRSLVGVLTLFFIKSELDDQIDNLYVVENKTGNLGLGNKGNFIIKFKFNNKEFALANGHLSAGDQKENFDKRISELKEIFDNIYETTKNVIYFISGDLNFRIDLPKEKFNQICGSASEGPVDEAQAKAKINELKKYDQMNEVKRIFKEEKLSEEKIIFPPTYKYNKGQTTYNGKRTPSWTDRILHKEDESIKCIFYDTINLYISDHKPLVGLFQISLK